MAMEGLAGTLKEGSYHENNSSLASDLQNGVIQTWSILILAVACASCFLWQSGMQRRLLPPGPPAWPFVGSLIQLMASRQPIHETLAKLTETYGPVMFFYLGSLPCLVVSSAEAAEMVLRDSDFAHRASETLLYTCRYFVHVQ